MEAKGQELQTIFKALIMLHEKFNEKALEKQEVVKRGDIPGLEKLMKQESALIQQLRKLEATRQHTINKLMEEKGFVKEDVTMEQIIKLFPEEVQQDLLIMQQRLLEEITTLKQQNQMNQELIEESLRFVNISLEAVHPQQQFDNYKRPDGKEDPPADFGSRSIFDSKA